MKNIHVLKTDKPSNGYILGKCIKELSDVKIGQFTKTYYLMFSEEYFQPQNIYITNSEEIKEGDYVYRDSGIVFKITKELLEYYESIKDKDTHKRYKIILTTDQDLIKDGVQAIDDDFLEWFVKNPSCEEVVVIYEPKNFFDVKKGWEYKIIIPKEEPNIIDQWLEKNGNPEITKQVDEEAKKLQKQHLIDMMKSDEELGLYEQTKCYCGHTTTCDCGPEQEITLEDIFNDEKRQGVKELIDKHNQETLKEAAERLVPQAGCELNNSEASYWQQGWIKGCVEGSKWQQENSYSEEDFKLFARQFYREIKMDKSNLLWEDLADKCLEQFKKK
jgi:hypothetical protein